jgi:hypothetical protein
MNNLKQIREFLLKSQELGFTSLPFSFQLETEDSHFAIKWTEYEVVLQDIVNDKVEVLDFSRINLTLEDHINTLKNFIK